MKRIAAISAVILFLFSCKSAYLPEEIGEITYEEFKNLQHYYKDKDGRIAYVDKGQGEVILLLHGVPSSSWLYRKMINGLVNQGYRVIAPDMLGFGNSDSPRGYDLYHPDAHARRILDLMDHLQITSWTHVFHDAGGLWTWELLRHSPERIDKLVVLNTIIYPSGFQPPIRFKRNLFSKFTMWLYHNGISTDAMLGLLFKEGLTEGKLSKTAYSGYKEPLMEGKTRGMYTFFSSTCNGMKDYSELIKSINKPTILIWGKHDEFLVFEDMREEVMEGLKLKEESIYLLEAKHFIQEEEPEKINQIILNFLK